MGQQSSLSLFLNALKKLVKAELAEKFSKPKAPFQNHLPQWYVLCVTWEYLRVLLHDAHVFAPPY
jgi:hypothetical protein